MIGFRLFETLSEHGNVSRGVCETQNGILKNVEEWTGIKGEPIYGMDSRGGHGKLSGNELVSMNVWAFPSSIFEILEKSFIGFLKNLSDPTKQEFYLPFAVDQWIKNGTAQVRVKEANCRWMGVTYKEDKAKVQQSIAKLVNAQIYPDSLAITKN